MLEVLDEPFVLGSFAEVGGRRVAVDHRMTAAIGSRGFWLQIIPMFYGATVFPAQHLPTDKRSTERSQEIIVLHKGVVAILKRAYWVDPRRR